MSHGEKNNILYPLQHGFRRGRSCETQLIEFIDDLSKTLKNNQQTDVLVMDFALGVTWGVILVREEKRKMSFFPRTVRDWNALPPDILELETLEAFKASVSVLNS